MNSRSAILKPIWAVLRGLGRFGLGVVTVLVAVGVPFVALMLVEHVFAININGFFKALVLLAAMFFVIVSLESQP